MTCDYPIAVTSRSFSSNPILLECLNDTFSKCRLNTAGQRLSDDALAEFLNGAFGAIVGIERIDAQLISRLPSLRVLSKYGVGLDSIDTEALTARGITLAFRPGTNSQAVAELALFLAIATLRRIPEALASTRAGDWTPVTGRLLTGKTVGLVGVGSTGRALCHLLERFDCHLLGYDPEPIPVPGVQFVGLDDLLQASDVVSIHVPLTGETRAMIGQRELALMKESAVLVNTSRGPVLDELALEDALSNGTIAAAGLDVLDNEPNVSWALARMRNVLVTPHIAGSSEESNLAMGMAAIEGLLRNLDQMGS